MAVRDFTSLELFLRLLIQIVPLKSTLHYLPGTDYRHPRTILVGDSHSSPHHLDSEATI